MKSAMLAALVLAGMLISSEQFAIGQPNDGAIKNLQDSSLVVDYDVAIYGTVGVPNLTELGDDEERELYYYEQTITVRDLKKLQDKTIRCEIVEVYQEQEAAEVLKALARIWGLTVRNVTMKDMIALMSDCDALDNSVRYSVEMDEEEYLKLLEQEEVKEVSRNGFLSGIVPGTKWCGFGDIAEDYHDLGLLRNTDRCCRAHDLCPIKILSTNERYDLNNTAKYTKSHCICDEAFHGCLKKNNGFMDKILGNVYFNVASPECIKGLPEFPEEKMKFVPATRKW